MFTIGIIASILTLLAIRCWAYDDVRGWPLAMVGNVLWFIYTYEGAIIAAIFNVLMFCQAAHGWRKWHQRNKVVEPKVRSAESSTFLAADHLDGGEDGKGNA